MKTKKLIFSAMFASMAINMAQAGNNGIVGESNKSDNTINSSKLHGEDLDSKNKKTSRLTFGGYGEAVYSRNFYSDNYLRYTDAGNYKNESHGRFDLPHVVFFVGYDFGKGWTLGSEIEFEHGGTESAVEIEEEEAGEYESEIERGGEVALEQFWIQKSFSKGLNIKLGHIIVPVGATNQHHMPTEFFGVYRPEGENTILPCTWHETGLSIWGRLGDWRYEAMLLPGLDSDRFNRMNWIQGGAGSPYEFKIANAMAGAFRLDNYSIKGLRLSLSGYVGNSFSNTLSRSKKSKFKDVKGTVTIGAFDFDYAGHNWIVRGNVDYGHLSDSQLISEYNLGMSSNSPSPKQAVASDAIAAGFEAGYNLMSQIRNKKTAGQKLYIFGRYDYYDSMHKTKGLKYEYCGRNRVAAGLNYYPIKEIVIKGEYSVGLLKSVYNNEPSVSLGVAYAGFFTK